jgi:hypothetical protein
MAGVKTATHSNPCSGPKRELQLLPGSIEQATEAAFQERLEQFKRARSLCLDAYTDKYVAEEKRREVRVYGLYCLGCCPLYV